VAVRADRPLEARGHGHMADSVAADDIACRYSHRSEAI